LGLGRGSTFTIRLPISRATPAAQPVTQPTTPPTGRRILLIEDNEEIAVTLRSLLEMSGHTVEYAFDGPSGIELARRFSPEIILCDIGLPGGMNGYDVARSIRADSTLAKAMLVAVTGYAREEDRARALAAGFDTHVRKPIDIDALDQIIAKTHS
jgi:CheY-like chemotaxis protein